MSMTAYDICAEVYGLSGFGIPSAFFESGDPDDRLIFFLLRRVSRDIAKYRWQQLVRTSYINITSDVNEYNLPNDFREMIPNSLMTMEDLRPINFPTDFGTWAQIDARVGITGVQHHMRFQADKIVTLPSDSESYEIRFDYISNFVCQDATDENIRKKTFTKDTDIWLLDDDLVIKALKVKWSLEKGLDTLQADAADYSSYLLELVGTQAMSQRIRMSGSTPYTPQAPYTNLWKS